MFHQKILIVGIITILLSACPSNTQEIENNLNPNIIVNVDADSIKNSKSETANAPKPITEPSADKGNITEASPEPEIVIEDVLKQVINDHVNAINTQDRSAFVKTIHSESEMFADLTNTLNNYVLLSSQFEIIEISVSSTSDTVGTLTVTYNHTVTNAIGQNFTESNKDLFTVKKEDDKWKIFTIRSGVS